MQIKPFKLISFDSSKWKNPVFSEMLSNSETKNKLEKTSTIMNFISRSISNGEAKIDPNPGLYLLNVENGAKSINLLIGSVNYDEKSIFLPNENTHPDKLYGYHEMFHTHKMQINPILTFCKENLSIDMLTSLTTSYPPKIQAIIGKANYSLWQIKNPIELQNIKNILNKINSLYIADGHHRFSIFKNISKKTNIMISITDSNSICLKSCHRVVTGNIDKNWKTTIQKFCTISDQIQSDTIRLIFCNGEKYSLRIKPEFLQNAPMSSLISNFIFNKSFGIYDSSRQIFPLPGNIDQKRTDDIFSLYQDSQAIVFIPDLDVSEFFRVVDGGNKLPPTSTWFEPKIIDGFLMTRFMGC